MKKKHKVRMNQDHLYGYSFVAPTIIGLLILNVYPLIQTIYLSFTSAKAFGDYDIVGLGNYLTMFTS